MNSRRKFSVFAWIVLAYNLPVILWGAYVRASFSGDGCGAHWPFCNGQALPQHMATPTLIEYTHRMMTSLDTLLVIALCVWALRLYPKRHPLRLACALSFLFLMIEALLGAGLVLLRLVANDQSAGRVVYLCAHLANTLLLLAALCCTAWMAHTGFEKISFSRIAPKAWTALLCVVGISITGVIAALGDTLFPSASVAAGVQQDFVAGAHALVRLRFLHPAIAVAAAIAIFWAVGRTLPRQSAGRVITLLVVQIAAGAMNMALLAPVWMQLIHLLIADLLWIATVVWTLDLMQPVAATSAARLSPTQAA